MDKPPFAPEPAKRRPDGTSPLRYKECYWINTPNDRRERYDRLRNYLKTIIDDHEYIEHAIATAVEIRGGGVFSDSMYVYVFA